MNLAFADRDFYYGDIYAKPEKPIAALLSKEYGRERAKLINANKNDPNINPGILMPSWLAGKTPSKNIWIAGRWSRPSARR